MTGKSNPRSTDSENVAWLTPKTRDRIAVVFSSDSACFSELVTLAELDPKKDFQYADLSSVDFSESDLRGYNFTGANLSRTRWDRAIYDRTTILHDAILDDVRGRDAPGFKGLSTIGDILSFKGYDVVKVVASTPLVEGLKQLSEHRIGAVAVVDQDGRLYGILSERDVIRAVGELGAGALSCTVGEISTRKVISCRASDTVPQILEMMTTGKFRHLPVFDSDSLIGIVSIGDIVKSSLSIYEDDLAQARKYIGLSQ